MVCVSFGSGDRGGTHLVWGREAGDSARRCCFAGGTEGDTCVAEGDVCCSCLEDAAGLVREPSDAVLVI